MKIIEAPVSELERVAALAETSRKQADSLALPIAVSSPRGLNHISTVNDSASNPMQILPSDLIARSGGLTEFHNFDEHLLSVVASTIVELSDCGGTDAHSAAKLVSEDHQELKQRWGWRFIEAMAQSLLAADILSLSKRYTALRPFLRQS